MHRSPPADESAADLPGQAIAARRPLRRHGEGFRSTGVGVRDRGQARRNHEERGIALSSAAANDGFAVPAEANRGLIFEFVQAGA